MKRILSEIFPPFLYRNIIRIKTKAINLRTPTIESSEASEQDLDIYWDKSMSDALMEWGAGSVWEEIQLLLINCKGSVLDIACGPGGTMHLLEKYKDLELYGIDISDLLISAAIDSGIGSSRLMVGDATKMDYKNNAFDFGYSIGSLEHFTEVGIGHMLQESKRVVKTATFHMIPVSRSDKNEGWMKTRQSFHNNSVDWWVEKFTDAYPEVTVLSSRWEDELSVGKWFVCKSA